jgi:predicted DNA binding CopG/RHH family protein
MEEKGINVKVEAELYKKVKIKIAEKGISLKQYIVELIENDLKESK